MQLIKRKTLYESARVLMLPIDDISPNPAQPRQNFDATALTELASSIAQYGVLQPISVRRLGRSFELVSGERRLRAAKLAGLVAVPCIVFDISYRTSSLLALVENLQRCDLDYLEEAEGISQLITIYGLTQDEAARRLGLSQSAVANKLRLLKLPCDVLYLLRDAGLSERHARALLRLPDDSAKLSALQYIVKNGFTVSAAEEYINSLLSVNATLPTRRNNSRYIIKDVRLFLNTIDRSMDIMRRSGIDAVCGREETDSDIVLTIKIPKKS